MSKRAARGLLVTFEGTEGAGKSTLIREIAARLKPTPVVLTREPGGTRVAERIREVILEEAMTPWTELFLYEAARAEHLAKTVVPALEKGSVVLCDRFTDSTLAYQAHARGLPWETVGELNRIATQGIAPGLTVLVDIDPAIGLKRASVQTRFEAEGLAFQKRVRAGFLKSKRLDPARWLVVNSGKHSATELAEQIVAKLKTKFPGKFRKAIGEPKRGRRR